MTVSTTNNNSSNNKHNTEHLGLDLRGSEVDSSSDHSQEAFSSAATTTTAHKMAAELTNRSKLSANKLSIGSSNSDHVRQSYAMPTAFRPGRLTNLEILERVFPLQRKSVLELVLQGCNGDLVKAIEHFLSAQDTLVAQHQHQQQQQQQQQQHQHHQHHRRDRHDVNHSQQQHHHHHHHHHTQQHQASIHQHPYINSSSFRPVDRQKLTFGSVKSAFTPLSPLTAFNGLHSAFTPHISAFTPDVFRNPFIPHHQARSAADLLSAPSQLAYQSLSAIPTSIPGILATPFSLHPYRTITMESAQFSSKIPEKNSSDKSTPTDCDQTRDEWDSGSGNGRNTSAISSTKDGD
ncbi:doublesex and mab-3 related transcription factor 3, truncated-like [Octopus vulgaris]|nr:doublesex and mab-3 related transcription factor 3, truncated-like [Octopus vulgaris]